MHLCVCIYAVREKEKEYKASKKMGAAEEERCVINASHLHSQKYILLALETIDREKNISSRRCYRELAAVILVGERWVRKDRRGVEKTI